MKYSLFPCSIDPVKVITFRAYDWESVTMIILIKWPYVHNCHWVNGQRYGHSVHVEGSVPLGTYASHVVLGKGTTLVKSHTTCQKHFFFDISLHVQTNMITVVFQRFLYLPNLTLLSPFLPTVLLVRTFFSPWQWWSWWRWWWWLQFWGWWWWWWWWWWSQNLKLVWLWWGGRWFFYDNQGHCVRFLNPQLDFGWWT